MAACVEGIVVCLLTWRLLSAFQIINSIFFLSIFGVWHSILAKGNRTCIICFKEEIFVYFVFKVSKAKSLALHFAIFCHIWLGWAYCHGLVCDTKP